MTVFFFLTGFVMYLGYGDKACREDFSYWQFLKRRYVRLLPVHWLCVALYAPIIFYNAKVITDDYYFWQNKSGTINLYLGWALNPLLMSAWIFAPLHYWNSISWSVSCQMGFYFVFPFLARWMKRKLDNEETNIGALGPSLRSPPPTGAMRELDAEVSDSFTRSRVTRKDERLLTATIEVTAGRARSVSRCAGAMPLNRHVRITFAVMPYDERIEARYRFRIRALYVLSFTVPFFAMMFFNSGAFKDTW